MTRDSYSSKIVFYATIFSPFFLFAQAPQMPSPTVVAAPVNVINELSPKHYVGMVESIRHVDIMPRVTGNLLKVNFKEGSIVKEGDLLYLLEDTTYKAAVDKVKAEKEVLEAALRYANTEFERSNTLLKSKAVSVSAHDKAILEIDAAKARLKELGAAQTDAENTLSYTKIYAPLTGRIGKSTLTAGNLITPTGGKLTDIEMVAPIYVRFSLSERIFRQDFGGSEGIREKAIVRVQLADNSIYHETAKITLIDNKINPSTNTITLWATFENKDEQLIPGSFVTVLIAPKTEKQSVAVAPSALIAEQNGYCVYVLDSGNKVVRREIKTGNISDGLQIITSGLDGSERVIIDGMNKVTPGMTVSPVAPDQVK